MLFFPFCRSRCACSGTSVQIQAPLLRGSGSWSSRRSDVDVVLRILSFQLPDSKLSWFFVTPVSFRSSQPALDARMSAIITRSTLTQLPYRRRNAYTGAFLARFVLRGSISSAIDKFHEVRARRREMWARARKSLTRKGEHGCAER